MTNQERIKKYLVGEKGYLKSDISNGKVIMLSGKWGSGKTHFWQNKIASDELKKELKAKREVYTYVSLYGKTSIEEIENDIFSQAYSSAIGGENFVTKGFSTFTKRMKRFGSSKIANGLNEEQNDNIERTALSRLNNGGIICFDDFERKSKDIDLNDLFGFITQLTLNFNCKVVIILNDDVFEGEEKNIFSNVKEKTVFKFLYFNPNIESQFGLLIDNYSNNSDFMEYWDLIVKTFEEIELINLRISLQVLENINEWINSNNEHNDAIIRALILSNINFILYHTLGEDDPEEKGSLKVKNFNNRKYSYVQNCYDNFNTMEFNNFNDYYIHVINKIYDNDTYSEEKKKDGKLFIDSNLDRFKSEFFLNRFNVHLEIDNEQVIKINNFIETGILIDE